MLTKRKSRQKFNARSLAAIGVVLVAVLSIGIWKFSNKAEPDEWQFYVSVHVGNQSQGDPETQTVIIDGLKPRDAWTVFRMTSVCDFNGPSANVERYMTGMSQQPEVLQMERSKEDIIYVRLSQPLSGYALTDFGNFMLEGLMANGLNDCGNTV